MKPENQGGLGDLVGARAKINEGVELLSQGLRKLNSSTADQQMDIDRLGREVGAAHERGYEDRDMDGQRLYVLLARFDKRDGSPLADLVQAAREGWERSHTDMAEDSAWDDFDRLSDRVPAGAAFRDKEDRNGE